MNVQPADAAQRVDALQHFRRQPMAMNVPYGAQMTHETHAVALWHAPLHELQEFPRCEGICRHAPRR